VAAVAVLRGHRKRQVVTAAIVVACCTLFVVQWSQAPRVKVDPAVRSQLADVRGQLYLGETFEGLPLRKVDPFLYSDCRPGAPKLAEAQLPCEWLRVADGRVTGGDSVQVERARSKLRPVEATR
jgi:hypothetical protein